MVRVSSSIHTNESDAHRLQEVEVIARVLPEPRAVERIARPRVGQNLPLRSSIRQARPGDGRERLGVAEPSASRVLSDGRSQRRSDDGADAVHGSGE